MVDDMISDERIENALDFLVTTAREVGVLAEQAKLAEHYVKHVKALEMKKWNEQSVSAQEREACASENYLKAIVNDAKAAGALRELMSRREAAETTISAWQTMVKAAQGPRP